MLRTPAPFIGALGLMNYYFRVIESYVHNGRIGVLVELGLQTDISTRMNAVTTLMKDLAMHIAASSPNDLETLLVQPFVKDPTQTVGEIVTALSKQLRERIAVTRFIRWDTELEPPTSDIPPSAPAVAMRRSGIA